MDNIDYIYLVGRFDNVYNVGFRLWDYRSATCDYSEAQSILIDACRKGHMGGQYKIFRVKVSDMKMMDTDKTLSDYTLIRDKLRGVLEPFCWYGNNLTKRDKQNRSNEVLIQRGIDLNTRKKVITISFEFSLYGAMAGRQEEIEADLEKLVKYAMTPKIQKVLREVDTDLRVEFKLWGRKLVKGFITKGVENETK